MFDKVIAMCLVSPFFIGTRCISPVTSDNESFHKMSVFNDCILESQTMGEHVYMWYIRQ